MRGYPNIQLLKNFHRLWDSVTHGKIHKHIPNEATQMVGSKKLMPLTDANEGRSSGESG